MGLLFAVVIFAMIPSGVEWHPVKEWPPLVKQDHPRADVAKPQVNARDEQQQSGSVPLRLDTQPQPPHSQSDSNQTGKTEAKDVNPERKLSVSDQIQYRLADLTLWLVVLTVVQAVIIGFQALYGVRAANAAKESATVARNALEMVERAYLATDRWEIKGNVVMCFVTNVGRMPATLINGSIGHFALVGDSPDPPLPLRQRQEITFKDTNIPAQASFPLKVSNLDLVVHRSIAHPTYAFHAFVHVNYLDGFGRELTLHADMRYDAEIRNFVIDGPRTLIEEDSNKKWDPYS